MKTPAYPYKIYARYLSLLLCLGGFALNAQAQLSIGFEAGFNKNELYSNLAYSTFARYRPVNGFNVGIPVQYQLNKWLAVQADPSYINKAYRLERSDFYAGIYQTTTNGYLKLPLMGQFLFGGDKLHGFANLGGYMAYWMSSRIQGVQITEDKLDGVLAPGYDSALDMYTSYRFNEAYAFNPVKDRRIELGLLAGIGASYQLNNSYNLFIEGRYYYGMTDMQKNYMVGQMPRYNNTYIIQAGVLFNLKNKRS